jgi:cyanate lyase
MNIYGALLFLQGHIINADLARQLAADADAEDEAAHARLQQTPVRGTCTPQQEAPAPGASSPCRST